MTNTRRAIVKGTRGPINHYYRTGEEVYAVRASFLPHYYDCRRVGGDRLQQSVSRRDLHFVDDLGKTVPMPMHSAAMVTFWVVITAVCGVLIGMALGYLMGGG